MTPTSISFVIPMYNEGEMIEETIRGLSSLGRELSGDYEIVIADDGSSDGSGERAEGVARRDPRVRVIRLKKNTKFGGALRAGIESARKEVIIYTDSDLPVDPRDVKRILSSLGAADIVTAYSEVRKGETAKRVIMSKVYNLLIQVLFRARIRDINSGFKIYKRALFNDMRLISRSPFIDVEIFLRAMRKGYTIAQCPIRFKHRDKGKSYIARPSVIMRTMFDMIRFRLGAG
jgi:glycosyltransferase involved in cell wall biosynthesis